MSDEISKHATLVEIAGKGVLLCGKSGAGKSDLAFRLIENHKAVLVADDVVLFTVQNGELYGEAPEKLKGLLEIRGVGIAKYPYFEKFPCLKLAFDSGKTGGTSNVCLNAANEEAVYAFLRGEIGFCDIYKIVKNAMDNYLVERETLEKFVDELMKKRTLPVDTAEEIGGLREKMIEALDDEIGMALFGSLDKPQLDAVNQLLDDEGTPEEAFRGFFERAGVNVDEVIAKTMEDFGKRFLGGENA